MIKKTALALILTLGLTGCQGIDKQVHRPIQLKPTVSTPPIVMISDCEDDPKTPCATWDEQEWRLVTSYHPYAARILPNCPTEDSNDCVWVGAVAGNPQGSIVVNIDGIVYVVR